VDLSNSEWNQCAFEQVQFGDANLQGAYFDHATLTDCVFEGTDLTGASFDGAHLLRTTVRNAVLDECELEGCQLLDCELRDLVLDGVRWSEVSATRIRIERVEGRSGDLTGVTLRQAHFDGFDTSGLTCSRCRASLEGNGALPEGFAALTGGRQRVT
jgi:uncharacterized protein YjbI with pentapeptide repeats